MIWSAPPPDLVLPPDAIHVWRAAADADRSRIEALARTVSPEERERAGRFAFQENRDRFLVRRGMVRALLGWYLAIPPERVEIEPDVRGKPSLAASLRFNVSHSGELILVAVALDREVGVDLERIEPSTVDVRIAEHFFSRREAAELRAVPAAQRPNAFFARWTRKEAYLKARGDGLAGLTDGGTPQDPRWSVRALEPGPGYVGALAAWGHGWHLEAWRWEWAEGVSDRVSRARPPARLG
jgi:4'-phosphopantetheinyl transferase